jgi:hypothetical protein
MTNGSGRPPYKAIVGLVNLERDAARLGPCQLDVSRQMPLHDGHLLVTHADQLPAEHDLRCLLL